MDFTKPIYAEVEGNSYAKDFREYLTTHGIKFDEVIDDYKYVGDYHVFQCIMTKEQMLGANRDTNVLFYQ